MKKLFLFLIVLLALTGTYNFIRTAPKAVTNFEECLAAGNPAMESYPRQCIHEGTHYTEVIEEEPCGDGYEPGCAVEG